MYFVQVKVGGFEETWSTSFPGRLIFDKRRERKRI